MNRSPVGNPIKGFPENLVFVQFDSRRILFQQTEKRANRSGSSSLLLFLHRQVDLAVAPVVFFVVLIDLPQHFAGSFCTLFHIERFSTT